jgi:LETM1 and EF-hand domain-containing protein 1
MTTEQLRELGEALSILSAKSSVLKERDELRHLMEENLHSEEVCTRVLYISFFINILLIQDPETAANPLVKRIRTMLNRIDEQLEAYDSRVGSSLQMISCDPQGHISIQELEQCLNVIKHKPEEVVGQAVIRKLDVDRDGYVVLEHVLDLVKSEGLGQ